MREWSYTAFESGCTDTMSSVCGFWRFMLHTKESKKMKRGGSDGQPSSKPLGGLIWKPLRGGLRICLESAPAPSLPPFGGGSTLFAPVPALPPSPTTNPLICSPAPQTLYSGQTEQSSVLSCTVWQVTLSRTGVFSNPTM